MSLTEPSESKWTAWFWLGIIAILAVGTLSAIGYLGYALWKGM